MQRVRKALRFVGRELGVQRPLIHARFRTDGVRLFVDHAGELLDMTSPEQERYRAGESVAELAQDYRLDPGQIEDAIRSETSEAA